MVDGDYTMGHWILGHYVSNLIWVSLLVFLLIISGAVIAGFVYGWNWAIGILLGIGLLIFLITLWYTTNRCPPES